MKLLLVLAFQLVLIQAWTIDLLIQNSKSARNYFRNYTIEIENRLACDKLDQASSTQGKFNIKNLKCSNVNCVLNICTESKEFTVDLACDTEFNMQLDDSFSPLYPDICKVKRNFELYSNGRVEYINK
ncbi:hypothetical protein CONCODRAFT_4357 [Conidiobolus coronatus NRRL 28638]|uniref:Cyanovirin-N domain-containing protein n=1 Tax=Conidiobolus coronatus (strain ATCC 28846 / CBS 209.66 / NRRL 28638) TaxID=796925 RepID=A0A137PCR0_CONC2|nr:hypothetical protein CONCODRAFT_4357 [Conidiobolus coronatus NRRL 28638]|eukprot:KXN72752.1 hypothetical protein CONCODRAFT_4357 [Conidiobolus coronatus NRRL 28638]